MTLSPVLYSRSPSCFRSPPMCSLLHARNVSDVCTYWFCSVMGAAALLSAPRLSPLGLVTLFAVGYCRASPCPLKASNKNSWREDLLFDPSPSHTTPLQFSPRVSILPFEIPLAHPSLLFSLFCKFSLYQRPHGTSRAHVLHRPTFAPSRGNHTNFSTTNDDSTSLTNTNINRLQNHNIIHHG